MNGDSGFANFRAPLQFQSAGLAVPAAPGAIMSASDAVSLNGAPNAARSGMSYEAPYAGILRNLFARADAVYGAGVGVTYTVWVNEGGASALTTTISGAAQVNNSDIVNSVAVAQGDRIYINMTRSAGVPGVVTTRCTVELARA